MIENNQLFVVKDSVLDLITVDPVYFSADNVVVKGIANGTLILSKPLPGAYSGMQVKIFTEKE